MADYDVVIHIGGPKTGSSAIQYFLLRNQEALEKHGFYYPTHAVDENNISGGHSSLSQHLAAGDLESAEKEFKGLLAQARKRGLTLLLSSEGLYSRAMSLSKILAGLRVLVVVFFRDPIESIVSAHNQLVKRAYYTNSLQFYCKNLIRSGDVAQFSGKMIFDWVSMWGEESVKIIPYDGKSFLSGSIEKTFLGSVGYVHSSGYDDFEFTAAPVNISYSNSALELKRVLNLFIPKDRDGYAFYHKADKILQRYSEQHPEEKVPIKLVLGSEAYTKLILMFADSNEAIKSNLNFPSSSGWLDYPADVEADGEFHNVTHKYSLPYVFKVAFGSHRAMAEYARASFLKSMMAPTARAGDIAKLCDLFGISQFSESGPYLKRGMVDAMLEGNVEPFRLKLNFISLLEDCGRNFEALSLAHQLNSGRRGIKVLEDTIDRLSMKMISQSVR